MNSCRKVPFQGKVFRGRYFAVHVLAQQRVENVRQRGRALNKTILQKRTRFFHYLYSFSGVFQWSDSDPYFVCGSAPMKDSDLFRTKTDSKLFRTKHFFVCFVKITCSSCCTLHTIFACFFILTGCRHYFGTLTCNT